MSPFSYLRRTAVDISLGDANPRLDSVDHFLLRRLLTLMQLALLAVFIEALIRQAEQESKQKKTVAEEALHRDEALVTSQPGAAVLSRVRNYLAARGSGYGAIEEAKSYVQSMSLPEAEKNALLEYCDHFQALSVASGRSGKSLSQMRAEVQPDHERLADAVEQEAAQLAALPAEIKELTERVSNNYHPERFVLTLILFFFAAVFYIWVGGTAIEVFSIALYMSADIKQIRHSSQLVAETEKVMV